MNKNQYLINEIKLGWILQASKLYISLSVFAWEYETYEVVQAEALSIIELREKNGRKQNL